MSEALAMAAGWLDDARLAIESRERASRPNGKRGDVTGPPRMAIWREYRAFRGEPTGAVRRFNTCQVRVAQICTA